MGPLGPPALSPGGRRAEGSGLRAESLGFRALALSLSALAVLLLAAVLFAGNAGRSELLSRSAAQPLSPAATQHSGAAGLLQQLALRESDSLNSLGKKLAAQIRSTSPSLLALIKHTATQHHVASSSYPTRTSGLELQKTMSPEPQEAEVEQEGEALDSEVNQTIPSEVYNWSKLLLRSEVKRLMREVTDVDQFIWDSEVTEPEWNRTQTRIQKVQKTLESTRGWTAETLSAFLSHSATNLSTLASFLGTEYDSLRQQMMWIPSHSPLNTQDTALGCQLRGVEGLSACSSGPAHSGLGVRQRIEGLRSFLNRWDARQDLRISKIADAQQGLEQNMTSKVTLLRESLTRIERAIAELGPEWVDDIADLKGDLKNSVKVAVADANKDLNYVFGQHKSEIRARFFDGAEGLSGLNYQKKHFWRFKEHTERLLRKAYRHMTYIHSRLESRIRQWSKLFQEIEVEVAPDTQMAVQLNSTRDRLNRLMVIVRRDEAAMHDGFLPALGFNLTADLEAHEAKLFATAHSQMAKLREIFGIGLSTINLTATRDISRMRRDAEDDLTDMASDVNSDIETFSTKGLEAVDQVSDKHKEAGDLVERVHKEMKAQNSTLLAVLAASKAVLAAAQRHLEATHHEFKHNLTAYGKVVDLKIKRKEEKVLNEARGMVQILQSTVQKEINMKVKYLAATELGDISADLVEDLMDITDQVEMLEDDMEKRVEKTRLAIKAAAKAFRDSRQKLHSTVSTFKTQLNQKVHHKLGKMLKKGQSQGTDEERCAPGTLCSQILTELERVGAYHRSMTADEKLQALDLVATYLGNIEKNSAQMQASISKRMGDIQAEADHLGSKQMDTMSSFDQRMTDLENEMVENPAQASQIAALKSQLVQLKGQGTSRKTIQATNEEKLVSLQRELVASINLAFAQVAMSARENGPLTMQAHTLSSQALSAAGVAMSEAQAAEAAFANLLTSAENVEARLGCTGELGSVICSDITNSLKPMGPPGPAGVAGTPGDPGLLTYETPAPTPPPPPAPTQAPAASAPSGSTGEGERGRGAGGPDHHLVEGFLESFYFFHHSIHAMPDLNGVQPDVQSVGAVVNFEGPEGFKLVSPDFPHDRIAAIWQGKIYIQSSGVYTFYTASDDGSHLWIDGQMIVDNGGLHGVEERSGEIELESGEHDFKADLFENDGEEHMVVQYSGPDTNGDKVLLKGLHEQERETAQGTNEVHPSPGQPGPEHHDSHFDDSHESEVEHGHDYGHAGGFHEKFYFIGHHLDKMPDVTSLHPDAESYFPEINYDSHEKFKEVTPDFPHDQVAAVWEGKIHIAEGGKYTFYTSSDDGSHLWIDGTMVVDNGGLHGVEERSGEIELTAGDHDLKADWFENGGGEHMVVEYSGPDTGDQKTVVHGWDDSWGHWHAEHPNDHHHFYGPYDHSHGSEVEHGHDYGHAGGFHEKFYFIGHHLDKMPDVTSLHPDAESYFPEINYDSHEKFKEVTPDFPHDQVAAVWEGKIHIAEGGKYTFYTSSDDGSHLWIDGTMVVDNGGLHGVEERSGEIELTAGDHDLKADWFENGGGEHMVVEYSGPDTGDQKTVVHWWNGDFKSVAEDHKDHGPGFHALFYFLNPETEYSAMPDLAGVHPDVEMYQPEIALDTIDKFKAIDAHFPASHVAAVWEGTIHIETGGEYSFYTSSDDGSHLWIDGKQVVDNGGLHVAVERSGVVELEAGDHHLKADWFNNQGVEHMVVRYSGPDTQHSKKIVLSS